MMVGQDAAAEQQRGGVALRVAADQQHALALLRHHVAEVGEGEALADAALAVDGDDLRFLLRPAPVDGGVRLDRRLGAQRVGHAGLRRLRRGVRHGGVHAQALQSRIIFRQAGSPNAVR